MRFTSSTFPWIELLERVEFGGIWYKSELCKNFKKVHLTWNCFRKLSKPIKIVQITSKVWPDCFIVLLPIVYDLKYVGIGTYYTKFGCVFLKTREIMHAHSRQKMEK